MSRLTQVTDFDELEIVNSIYVIRGQKVMLDRDLAEMYGVTTFRLNEAVKRNSSRFPEDFMFQLSNQEFTNLISQNAMSSSKKDKTNWGGIRRPPFAFTEHGVAMLSSVLRSEQAVQVNIRIIRVYNKMKQILLDSKELWQKIEEIERSLGTKNDEIKTIFEILKKILIKENKPRPVIGFKLSKQK